ncbi:MAG: 4Fe-4S dicluster domain-containing protein, partial [Nitrososphaerales archaeon]
MQTYAQTDILDAVRGVIGDHRPEACYQCMKCTSGCPAAKVSEYKPHMMVILTKAGLAEEVMKSGIIWACSMCLKCKEYCPQDVAPFDVVTALKN